MLEIKTQIRQKFLFLLAFLFTGLSTCITSAQVDPEIHWKVMRLPHFDLMYDAKHQDLANLYADRLEDNLSFLREYFEFFPEKTVVVINDRTDLTNGSAAPIPYRTIMIYPVLPGPQETISDYGDWARELTMHEYTHVLSFEPRRGLVKGLYYTFGSIITPNLLLPRWWLEGVAVDMETRTSGKGRLRSPYQDAIIRAYVNEHQLEKLKLAEINETSIHTWPQGARPYLFGSLMWSELISRHGKKMVSELHHRYGGRVPYFLEGPMYDETGGSYSVLMAEMKEQLSLKVSEQMKTLKTVPFSEGPTLKVKNGAETFAPVISPDGLKMIIISKDDATKRSVRILKRPSTSVPFDGSQEWAEIDQRLGESLQELNPTPRNSKNSLSPLHHQGLNEDDLDEDAPPGGTIQRLSWFPDSKKFVFDKLDAINRFHDVSDLYVFDLMKMKIDRLTKNERAREADVSPNGKQLSFVKLGAGRTDLALINLEDKKIEIVYSPALQVRISSPTYISETELVFSERDEKGREILKKYSLQTKQVQEILPEFTDARYPRMTSKGLLFSSYKNGTGNAYLASADLRSAQPLTHTSTLITSTSLDLERNEIYASELTTQGFQIRQLPLSSATQLPAQLPKISALMADRYPPVQRDVPSLPKPEPEEYSIWPYILPHYWLPNIGVSNERTVIGGSIGSSDPLAKHAYTLTAFYDSETEDVSHNFLYANNTTSATVLLKGLDYRTYIVNTSREFREQQYGVDVLWEVTPISTDLFAGVGYNWIGRSFLTSRTEAMGPSILANYSDIVMSGAQISPESGQAVNFSATEYTPGENNREDFRLYQLSIQKFSSKWLPRHHALMVRAQGQFIDKDVNVANYAYTVSYSPFLATSTAPIYVMRGYLGGQFLGKSLANYTFEYRFPIFYLFHGAGTAPIFIKRVHGAVVADGASVDGFSYNKTTKAYEAVDKWKSFWSSGLELKFDLTIGYHFPVTFYMGYYFPHDSKYKDGDQFAIGFQL